MDSKQKQVKVIKPTIGVVAESRTRVAAYCRVSTDSFDQMNSFIAQVKYYNDFIRNSNSMELVDIYADEGITGTCINKRDEFQRMMKDCKAGKVDRIYVKSVSRFARNSLECIESIRLLKKYGTAVFFENDGIDTECMNSEMILYIKSAFAQSESLAGSKRVSTAIRMRMESGDFITTTAPYGYKLNGKTIEPIPEEAEVVKLIFQKFLSGKGFNRIYTELRQDDLITEDWSKERIRYILSNEKYIGDSLLQKSYTPAVLPLKNQRNNGVIDQFYVQNSHEAIIDRFTFEEAKRLLNKKRQKFDKSAVVSEKPNVDFTKKVYCGECGWSLKKKKQNYEIYWVCSHNGVSGVRCKNKNLTEANIANTFIAMYNKLRQNEAIILDYAIHQLSNLKSRLSGSISAISEIDEEIADLSEQDSMFARLRADEIMDDVTYTEQTSEIKQRIAELRSRRLRLLNEDSDETSIEALRKLKEQLSEFPVALLEYDHSIFCSVIKRAVVNNDDSITFEFDCDLKLKEQIVWN